MEEFLTKKNAPASKTDIKNIEQILGFSLPEQYKELLLVADGAEFKHAYIKPFNEKGNGDWIMSYNSLSSSKCELDTLFNYDNKNNIFVQYQNHLFPIAGTSWGNGLYIGISDIYRDKIFISDQDEDVSEDEKTVFPVYQLADSLRGFLGLLQPNPED